MHDPHDRLFRRVFSDPEHAAGELRLLLPAAVSARIDWTTLRPEKTDFVRDVLSEVRSDVLFSAEVDGRELFFYLLMEHQSTAEPLMPLRLLGYLVQIHEHYVREHPGTRQVPAVVPMVVHHSERGWTAPTRFEDVLDLDSELAAALSDHIPRFEMLLDDVSSARDEDLRARSMTELGRLALLCLSRARSSGDFIAELQHWSDALVDAAAAPNGVAALASLISYIVEVIGAPPERLRTFLSGLGPRVEEASMTIAQTLRKEGEAKGRAETLLKLLELKFKSLPADTAERIRHASIEELERWTTRVLDAKTLDEVVGDTTGSR